MHNCVSNYAASCLSYKLLFIANATRSRSTLLRNMVEYQMVRGVKPRRENLEYKDRGGPAQLGIRDWAGLKGHGDDRNLGCPPIFHGLKPPLAQRSLRYGQYYGVYTMDPGCCSTVILGRSRSVSLVVCGLSSTAFLAGYGGQKRVAPGEVRSHARWHRAPKSGIWAG